MRAAAVSAAAARAAGRGRDDLPLEAIGEIVAATPPEGLIEQYEASRTR